MVAVVELLDIDKWNGPGAEVYKLFKEKAPGQSGEVFDESIEANELRSECQQVQPANPGLFAARKKSRR